MESLMPVGFNTMIATKIERTHPHSIDPVRRKMLISSAARMAGIGRSGPASPSHQTSQGMRVELFPPDPDRKPRHWGRHDQAFAMMLRPGAIERGSERCARSQLH